MTGAKILWGQMLGAPGLSAMTARSTCFASPRGARERAPTWNGARNLAFGWALLSSTAENRPLSAVNRGHLNSSPPPGGYHA